MQRSSSVRRHRRLAELAARARGWRSWRRARTRVAAAGGVFPKIKAHPTDLGGATQERAYPAAIATQAVAKQSKHRCIRPGAAGPGSSQRSKGLQYCNQHEITLYDFVIILSSFCNYDTICTIRTKSNNIAQNIVILFHIVIELQLNYNM